MTEVRHALPTDLPAITAALTEAFRFDPFQRFLFPDPGDADRVRLDALTEFMDVECRLHLDHGHLYVVDERAAALWAPPGVFTATEPLSELMGRHVDPATFESAIDDFMAMFGARPEAPHFYLAVIGARDDARGQGLGAHLLARVLDICDREGLPAHLESSNPRNVSFYERHGFAVTAEVEFAPGVIVRPMTREPQPG